MSHYVDEVSLKGSGLTSMQRGFVCPTLFIVIVRCYDGGKCCLLCVLTSCFTAAIPAKRKEKTIEMARFYLLHCLTSF